jgi:two-component sensor histidine kinase
LLINAVEHGFPAGDEDGPAVPMDTPRDEVGEVVVSAHRFRKQLHVTVADNGQGLPDGFKADSSGRLGLQIVRALATGELRGSIELRNRSGGGTEAVLVVPLGKR